MFHYNGLLSRKENKKNSLVGLFLTKSVNTVTRTICLSIPTILTEIMIGSTNGESLMQDHVFDRPMADRPRHPIQNSHYFRNFIR